MYSSKELNVIAQETGFKVRKSKLTPEAFIDTVMFKESNSGKMSLDDHCISIKQRHEISIKKQSLSERFDETAVAFIRQLLDRHLSSQINSEIGKAKLGETLKHFTSVKIKDSTRFQISACHKEYYPGSSGAATGAGVHIQFEFDLLNGKVNDLNVTDALRADTTDASETIDKITQGELIIRDLGYYSNNALIQMSHKGAFYITRTHAQMPFIHALNGKRIDLDAVYRMMKVRHLSHTEIPIILGRQTPSRLIIEMLPEKEVEKRLAKASHQARKKGYALSDEYKSRVRLNIFLTNIPTMWVSTKQVRQLYRLRWQIELRFKAWKSFFDLEAEKKMKRHRFECYLYATLLLLMINFEIATNFFAIIWQNKRKPLSFLKFHRTASNRIAQFQQAITNEHSIRDYLASLYQISCDRLLAERRKGHRGCLEEILVNRLA